MHPGDIMDATTAYSDGQFVLTIADLTTRRSFTDTAACAACHRSSAEWIVERTADTLVGSYPEWVFGHPQEARFVYQATAVELSGPLQHDVLKAKAQLYQPLFTHLGQFAATGELPTWPRPALTAIALGPSHHTCQHQLAGGDLDKTWALTELPEIAWRSLQPHTNTQRPYKPPTHDPRNDAPTTDSETHHPLHQTAIATPRR